MSNMTALDFCLQEGHVEPVNPRSRAAFDGVGACARCGRKMERDEMPRDVETEDRWLEEAAEHAQYVRMPKAVAHNMNAYRHLRMGDGPWRDVSIRSWVTEAEEEAIDASAYIMAALQELGDVWEQTDEDSAKAWMSLRMALSAAVTMYAALGEYRAAAES